MKISIKQLVTIFLITTSWLMLIPIQFFILFDIFHIDKITYRDYLIEHKLIVPFALLALGILIGTSIYWYYFPEFNGIKNNELKKPSSPVQIIKYISTKEEADVIDAIINNNNRAYQFEIARYTGMSRMKVHRIVQRLIDRNIVIKEKVGKNSRITLADWIIQNNEIV